MVYAKRKCIFLVTFLLQAAKFFLIFIFSVFLIQKLYKRKKIMQIKTKFSLLFGPKNYKKKLIQ